MGTSSSWRMSSVTSCSKVSASSFQVREAAGTWVRFSTVRAVSAWAARSLASSLRHSSLRRAMAWESRRSASASFQRSLLVPCRTNTSPGRKIVLSLPLASVYWPAVWMTLHPFGAGAM